MKCIYNDHYLVIFVYGIITLNKKSLSNPKTTILNSSSRKKTFVTHGDHKELLDDTQNGN